jgi:hypothetical protein
LLIVLTRSPFSDASAPTEARLLMPELETLNVAKLELSGDEDTLTLVKQADGWIVEEAGGFPASAEKIDGLLDDLRTLQVRRPVVSSGRYHSAFKVADDEHEGRVRVFSDESSSPAVDLILGNSPNYQITHVRREGEPNVYEARGIAPYDVSTDSGAWIEKQLVDIDEEAIIGIAVKNAEGSFELTREDGVWIVSAPASQADQELDQDKVLSLIRTAGSIRVEKPVGPADPAGQGLGEAEVTLTVEGAAPVTVQVGSKVADNDSQRYIGKQGFDFAATVWDSSVRKIVEQKLGDLIAG